MALRAVLILTAGFGEGHNAAARNLAKGFADVAPETRVEVHDVFADAYGFVNRLAVRGYLALINLLPWAWEIVFRWLDRTSAVRDGIGVFGLAVRRLNRVIRELRPDVIVTTYPGYVHLLDHVERVGGSSVPGYVTLVTDSLSINSVWYSGRSEGYIVANEETAEVMRRAGVRDDLLHVLGFPVPLFFADEVVAKRPPSPGEKWKVLFMVNSGKRIALEVVRELIGIEDIELVVTVGRDDALERRIRELAAGRDDVRVYGWTSELPRLMTDAHVIVSKAGGATVQECLAARTPMIISQVVPGQEEGNARLIVREKAGEIAETARAISDAVRNMKTGNLWNEWHAATQRLGRPDAARDVARWLGGRKNS